MLYGYRWWDSNPHVFRQSILSAPRLPFRHTGKCCVSNLPAVTPGWGREDARRANPARVIEHQTSL